MFCWLSFACSLWLVSSVSSGMDTARRYVETLSPEARLAIAEKMKYILPRNDRAQEGVLWSAVLPSQGCPYLAEVEKKLKEKKKQQNDAIKTAFKEVTRIITSLPENCTNATQARDQVLSQLNASLNCEVKPPCDSKKMYRETDGSCNNLEHPDWGQRDSCLRRVLSPDYGDGVSTPRLSCNGAALPSARLVSTMLHEEKNMTHKNMTHLAMIFGQFMTHDITFVSFVPLSFIEFELGPGPFNVCLAEDGPECIPIDVPENDTFYRSRYVTKLPILRSLYCEKCEHVYRDQVNSRTSYMDLSQVYGIKGDIQASIRQFEQGLLISQENDDGTFPPDSLFPYADNCTLPKDNRKCSWTGDLRATQHIALLSMQTLFLREHNRIAKNLSEINPHWDDEKVFQTARRILEGRYQHIVFKEWLPWMLGHEYMEKFNLTPKDNGYTTYDPSVDATVTNEFSAAAFRFGHSQADKNFWRQNKDSDWLEPANLSTGYFVPHNNSDDNHDSVLRGSLLQPMQMTNRHGDEAVRNNLFRQSYLDYGSDLFATDIQRGREHGLRPYVDYVQYCQNITIENFNDLNSLMEEGDAIGLFQSVYTNVRDIDLFSGGLSEKHVEGGEVGRTFACLIAEVFNRLKFGDRFYYEHQNQTGSFTPEQLQSLRNSTLASIFCKNIKGLTCIQKNVFLRQDYAENELVSCSEVQDVNLELWKEDQKENVSK